MKKFFILILLLTILIPGIAQAADITSKEQLNHRGIIIGVSQGSVIENFIKREFPNASLAYFTDGGVLGYQAVAAGKIDAYAADLRQMELSLEGGFSGVHLLDETLNETMKTAVGISEVSEIPDLEKKINEFLSELRDNGTLNEMFQRWVVDGNEQMPEIELDDDPEYHLVVGTAGIVPPYSYYKDTKLNGHDIELAYRFADWLDADLEFKVIDFTGLVPAAMSGKIDCIMSDLQVSEERQENFTFSIPVMEERVGIMVRGEAVPVSKTDNDFTVPSEKTEEKRMNESDYAQYDGKRIGVVTGSTGGPAVEEKLPNAKISYFDSVSDMLTALRSQKVDAIAATESILKFVRMEGENISLTEDHLLSTEIAALFPKNEKGQKLEARYSEFVKKLWDDGTIDEINSIWFGDDESKKTVPDYENLPETNGTLTMAVDTGIAPFVYLKNGKIVGYDVDIAARFCEAYGYRLIIQNMSFPAVIPSVVSGKSDFSACDIAITPERAESVLFSEPTYYDGLVLAVPGENIKDRESGENSGITSSLPSMDGKTIGTLIGSTAGPIIEASFPNANISYFDSIPDVLTALRAEKVDASVMDDSLLRFAQMEGEKIIIFDENLKPYENAAVFPKNEKSRKLEAQYSEFIKKLWDDGTMAEIDAKWFGTDDSQKTVIDYEKLPATNGTLTMASTTGVAPFVYMKDNQIVGYEVEIAARFCETYGYRLEIVDMAFSAILPSVISGKADFSSSAITITPERAESVLFSEPLYHGGIALAIKGDPNEAAKNDADSGISDQILAMDGKRIAILTGSISNQAVQDVLPSAKLSYYDNVTDMLTALKANKVDSMVWDDSIIRYVMTEGEPIRMLDGYLHRIDNAAVFSKDERGKALEAQFSEYVKKLWDNGTIRELDAKWYAPDNSIKTVIDYENLPGPNGTLIMAADPSLAPFSYVKDGQVVGYEIEIAARFCEEYGYRLEVQTMSFASMIPAVVSGKADFASSCITITPERAESVLFSEPIYRGGEVFAVLAENDSVSISDHSADTALTLSDMDGKRIGVQTGQTFDKMVLEVLPDAEIIYVNSKADLINSLLTKKIDSYAVDEPVIKTQMRENDKISYIPEYLSTFEFGYVFPKTDEGEKLRSQFSEFIRKIRTDGTMDEIEEKWMNPDQSQWTLPDYASFPAPNGKLIMATEALYAPFTFIFNNEIVGYDIDIAARFCEAYGYGLEITDMEFSGIIPSVQSGKSDFGGAGITITAERAESVLFSEPNYSGGTVMAILKDNEERTYTSKQADTKIRNGVYKSFSELSGKKIGVQTGAGFDEIVLNVIPDAKIVYLNNKADLVNSLLAFKIDGFVVDEPVAEILAGENSRLTYIPDYLDAFDFGYVFPRNDDGEDLCDEFSEFLEDIKSDGTLEEIERRWFSDDESGKSIPDYKSFPAPNGTLRLAVEALYEPFCYIANNQIVGYDIDIAVRFCEANGYGLEIKDMSFDSVLPAVQTGKADFGGSGINITPERAESVLFSEPNYSGGTVVVVLREDEIEEDEIPEFKTFSELNGKTVSMLNGAPFEELFRSKGTEAGQFTYYNNMPDAILALTSGKTDAFITNSAVARLLSNRNEKLAQFPKNLEETMFGFAFAKGSPERETWQSAYETIPEKTKRDLWDKWTDSDESKKVLPVQDWPGTNGTVTVAACDTLEPMSYKGKGGELIGFDEEIILLMAKELDVHVNFIGMEFSVILSTVQSGKALFGAGSIMITKERAESVDFLPYYPASFVMLVRAADFAEEINTPTVSKMDTVKSGILGTWESIKASFEKTFIRENRWKLFMEGIGNTLLITVLSIIFGTILGFLLFMVCRNGNPLANGITAVCTWLVQGMPGVVLLMILFYVVFGSVAIDGIIVAVIGFTLTFGSSVLGLLKIGVGAIDQGQYEAAYALGYSDTRTFFRIILPQAIPHVMGAYKGEIVGLLKATAIVGYIAVQDLTKMGDIVRSRTYEAFFPLIAVTIIYFVLEGIWGFIISRINIQIDPKRRKRENILKGVKTND
ncbi:MAG: transporter substrate-binding domain-containing protein [Anaerolineaceae bacterium]|nr:transporter substrate-binding domain-containing protein [Anaerolineaceae bacterium]